MDYGSVIRRVSKSSLHCLTASTILSSFRRVRAGPEISTAEKLEASCYGPS